MEIRNRTAVVTGGASGLGEATVRRLLGFGARVVIFDINAERGKALVEELGDNLAFCRTNIAAPEEVEAAVGFAVEKFGGINILVNCAAIGIAGKIAGKKGPHDLQEFRRTIEVNLIGTFDVTRQVAFKMLGNEPDENGERGVIISTASVAAFEGQIGQIAYTASKAAIAGMTIVIARDLMGDGVRACTIAPGLFDTPLLGSLPDEVKTALGKMVPFPSRLGKPQEYAMLAQSIIENPMLNGEVIRLDGALRMAPK
ncbi:MAG: 3-hydroxyacyl-CoA dehydrogenase [Firmicutes bacterium]|nr:3-hydroxyacyl-CoA dehydrogenase [Bacillota bacterium]